MYTRPGNFSEMSHWRLALRGPLRLTRQTTDDEVERRSVQRGFSAAMRTAELAPDSCDPAPGGCVDDQVQDELDEPEAVDNEPIPVDEPTSYELESKSSVAGWEEVRSSVLNVLTESCAMKIGQGCLKCKQDAYLRCLQCGPLGFFVRVAFHTCIEC